MVDNASCSPGLTRPSGCVNPWLQPQSVIEIIIGAYKSLYVGQKFSALPDFFRNRLDLPGNYAESL